MSNNNKKSNSNAVLSTEMSVEDRIEHLSSQYVSMKVVPGVCRKTYAACIPLLQRGDAEGLKLALADETVVVGGNHQYYDLLEAALSENASNIEILAIVCNEVFAQYVSHDNKHLNILLSDRVAPFVREHRDDVLDLLLHVANIPVY